jgi:RND family efflux transporter MFP subunit
VKFAKYGLVFVCIMAAWLGGYGYGRWYGPRQGVSVKSAQKPTGYHCPMHPNFRSDKPGVCGICGMNLVPDVTESAAMKEQTGKILFYRDPYDHNYKSDKPGLNPETGNGLEAVYENGPQSMPPGVIDVSADKQQLIGVRWGTAELTVDGRQFRSAGKVTVDERSMVKIQPRIDGWIERIFVDFVGRRVEKGEPLLTIYSPELLASQQEYLLALRSRELLTRVSAGETLAAAARKRLELFDLSEEQIKQIERTGQPINAITLYSPGGGHVMMRNAFPKQRVTPETELYVVADLSRVWVMAEVFESDARLIRTGMSATVSAAYAGGGATRAKVDYIQPEVDPMTRTLKVRLEVDNATLKLKPEMYVDVDFVMGAASRLTVASEAVLNSGLRQTVFVDLGNGFIEPRAVRTGERLGQRIEIVSGLKAGERIAVSGNFLLDSESQLKAAARGGQ